jgi:hypothetical protein
MGNLRSINVAVTNAECEPDTLDKAVSIRTRNVTKSLTHTTMPETSQIIAERKLKASAAFQRPHVGSPLNRQDHMLPQGSFLIVSTRTPKAANQASEMRISTGAELVLLYIKTSLAQYIQGQEKNPDEKGISHIRASNIDKPAITSVYIHRDWGHQSTSALLWLTSER